MMLFLVSSYELTKESYINNKEMKIVNPSVENIYRHSTLTSYKFPTGKIALNFYRTDYPEKIICEAPNWVLDILINRRCLPHSFVKSEQKVLAYLFQKVLQQSVDFPYFNK